MPAFAFTLPAFQPFTKILSADVNTMRTDLTTFFNTTKLDDDNIQNAGITRATKLKLGTAAHVLINDGTGAMSSEAQLALTRGGTGISIVPGSHQPGDVLQVNSGSSALEVSAPTSVAASLRMFQYFNCF